MPEKPQGLGAFFIALIFAFLKILARLPYPILNAIGRTIGRLMYLIKKRRQVVEANLRYCYPELSFDERQKLCKAHFLSLGTGFVELMVAWYKPFKDLEKYHEVKGLEHYQKALESGRGILFLGYHITSLELAGALMSKYLDFAAFYRPNKNKALDYHIQKGRNNRTQTIGRNDIRSIGKWLKSGKHLWLMPDQDFGHKGTVFAPFYGKPMSTITSPMRIAKLGNAIVLPVSYHKNKQGKMVIEVLPEIQFTGDDEIDCSMTNKILEVCIDQAREQYYWVHRRFKTLPEGQRGIYQQRPPKVKTITAEQHDGALYSGKIISRINSLPKLVETIDGQTLNLFQRRTSFGIDITLQELQNMLQKCYLLAFRGFYTISPQEFTYCAERQAYLLRYQQIPGISLQHIPSDKHQATAVLLGNWLGQLHNEGVYLKDIRQTNIQILPNGNFVLLNPTECQFFESSLNEKLKKKDQLSMLNAIDLLQQESCIKLFNEQYQLH
ncbi:MAG: lysophospholipid acyltransferase family protein [Kangiellaceae bacterium]|nr:lysophospholipid acyltransferase family protein [Kangiellaceae bacterium]